jgi:hypothetical protein
MTTFGEHCKTSHATYRKVTPVALDLYSKERIGPATECHHGWCRHNYVFIAEEEVRSCLSSSFDSKFQHLEKLAEALQASEERRQAGEEKHRRHIEHLVRSIFTYIVGHIFKLVYESLMGICLLHFHSVFMNCCETVPWTQVK